MFNKNFDRVDTRKRSGRFQKILHRSAGLQGGGGNAVRAGSQMDPIGVSGGRIENRTGHMVPTNAAR